MDIWWPVGTSDRAAEERKYNGLKSIWRKIQIVFKYKEKCVYSMRFSPRKQEENYEKSDRSADGSGHGAEPGGLRRLQERCPR
jgi:hypothetical protein